MISDDQAANALSYLEALAAEGLASLLQRVDAETAKYNIDQKNGAIEVLRGYLDQNYGTNEIAVMYEYKLQRQDGKFLDKDDWSLKGKTYKSKAAMASALGRFISEQMEKSPSKPRFKFELNKTNDPEYQAAYEAHRTAYNEWYKEHTTNKEVRARYLPLDWVVICIPVNIKGKAIYKSAKMWYINKGC